MERQLQFSQVDLKDSEVRDPSKRKGKIKIKTKIKNKKT
jgi:hypothetical protein